MLEYFEGRDVELSVKVDGDWVNLGTVRMGLNAESKARADAEKILSDVKEFDTVVLGGGYRGRGTLLCTGVERYAEHPELRQFPPVQQPHKPPMPKGPRGRWGNL